MIAGIFDSGFPETVLIPLLHAVARGVDHGALPEMNPSVPFPAP
ncbi:MAG: hypothetical protein JWP25_5940 [Bradyrhizobium sp.]|nr:hypothetical protein [Bradyrhizobium sp.]